MKKKIILSTLFLTMSIFTFGQSNVLSDAPVLTDTPKCKAELPCNGGGKASCEGKKSCRVFSWYVECDGVTSYCNN